MPKGHQSWTIAYLKKLVTSFSVTKQRGVLVTEFPTRKKNLQLYTVGVASNVSTSSEERDQYITQVLFVFTSKRL